MNESENMLSFIVRRVCYSALVILGVVLLTFLLFRLAAGDPAAAVLGKNPSAAEVEALRLELGSDLPLFYGDWRRSEVFSNVDFTEGRLLPGVESSSAEPPFRAEGLQIDAENQLTLKRNIRLAEPVRLELRFSGRLVVNGKVFEHETLRTAVLEVPANAAELNIGGEGVIASSACFRAQASPFDSQFFNALHEIFTIKPAFPYVSFFNFGKTVVTREPIRDILWRGVWPSLWVMTPIFLGELLLGIVLALLATARKDSWVDRLLLLLAIAAMSVSYLVMIIFGQWMLGYYYNFFPVWGWGGLRHLLLPVLIGIVCGLGGGVRFYRTVFVNELNKEYLRTARAKGCHPVVIFGRHLLRNAAIPIITRATSVLPFLFTGSLLLETFFGIPGLGYTGIDALNNSDLQLLKALVIISALLFVVLNLLADIAYAWADPRIRLRS